MKPIYKVEVNGTNITELIKTHLLSLTVTDAAGFDSDTVELELDDRDARLGMPSIGAQMTVWLGYEKTGLVNMGDYIIDEITLSGAPESMTLRGKAASMAGERAVKMQKTRQWTQITLNSLVSTIASEHSLTPVISPDLQSINIKDLAQTDESNINLLTRIAGNYDAVVKVTSSHLLFIRKGQSKTASGEQIQPIIVHRSYCKPSYNVTFAARDAYASVKATWHDKTTAKTESVDYSNKNKKEELDVQTSSKEPQKILRHTYDSPEQAERAAQAEMARLTRGTAQLTLSLSIGMPNIAAENFIALTGFRVGISGDWNVKQVTHTWSNSGATSSLTAESI